MWLRALNAIHLSEQNLIESALKAHASYLENNLEYRGRRTNNHILKDAQGLMYAGCLFFDDKNAERWRDTAKQILFSELDRQFDRNGVHREQTSHYHCLCAKRYIDCFLLADKANLGWAEDLLGPITSMVNVVNALTFPDATLPIFSDVSPDEPPYLAMRTVLNAGGYLLPQEKYFQKSGGLNLEALWLLGTRVLNSHFPPSDKNVNRQSLEVFPESFAAGDGDNLCWRIDCGPVGFAEAPGHGHNDMLSLQIWHDGHLWIRDGGINTYDDDKWKRYFRGTYAHSTVVIDGKEQIPAPGKLDYILRRVPIGKAYPVWLKTADRFTALLCEHTGYLRRGLEVRHRRLIVISKLPEYVVTIDYLLGEGKHTVEQLFQIDCERALFDKNKNGFELEHGNSKFSLIPFSNKDIRSTIQDGFFSPYYGNLRESRFINISAQAQLPLICGAVLIPEGISRIDVEASFDNNEPGLVLKLSIDTETQHYIGVNFSGGAITLAPFEGEFELACRYNDADGKLRMVSDGECRISKDFGIDQRISKTKFDITFFR